VEPRSRGPHASPGTRRHRASAPVEKQARYSAMQARAPPKNKLHCKIQVPCGWEFSRRTTLPTICCHDSSSTPSSSPTLHRLPTSTTTTTPSETDEAGRPRRAPLMSQRRCTGSWTDEAMDDADAIYTTTTTTHAWRIRAKINDDDHSSRIGGTPAS